MVNYLIKILLLLVFSFFVILNYYSSSGLHVENFDGYLPYILIIGMFYGLYKFLQFNISKEKAIFTPFGILNYFLLHLFTLCILFFSFNSLPIVPGLLLFFKIIFYLILPTSIILINIGFGKKVLNTINMYFFTKNKENTDKLLLTENKTVSFLSSLGIGFFSFTFLLTIFGILGAYNLYVVFGILLIFLLFSFKELSKLFDSIFTHKMVIDIKEGNYVKLLTSEFLFIVSSLVLSVTLINIVRPFPIGWDDLGVYMNYPHLLAEAGSIISLGGMYTWQVFTGIGYMFDSTVQAFFLNAVGGFLSFISIILITSDLLKSSTKKTIINIPLLAGTIFISMPMIVFQQAKDMKLDAGLFFVSIISLYLLYKFYLYKKDKSNKSKDVISKLSSKKEDYSIFKNNIIVFLIIGLLAGLAFSIKFTSLLLISAIFGVIFFARLGLFGFLGYLGIYFAIFTKLGLWNMMNVVVNPGKIQGFETSFFFVSASIGVLLIACSLYLNKKNSKKIFIEFFAFLLGIIIALIPWIGKNIIDVAPNISVRTIIGGKSEAFQLDLTKIYSEEEIKTIKNKSSRERMTSSGTTTNEDFGRYFGYEKGINNYVKLPWNLTMQNNQSGEFTDIGYIFLALIPLIFLFLPFKNKYFSFLIILFLGFELLLFFHLDLTSLMSKINLPLGYLFILLGFLTPLIYFIFLLKDNRINYLFKLNLVFTVFYTFLWTISAFGIVWYGIVMYFSFLLLISVGLYYLSNYNEDTLEKDYTIKVFGSLLVFIIISLYFINSVFPHTFSNLKKAAYSDYKLGNRTTAEAPFFYHREYLNILYELNISDEKRKDFILSSITSNIIIESINKLNAINSIENIIQILKQYQIEKNIPDKLRQEAKKSENNIYSGILNPKDEYKNKIGIYRIGTFLKYHISENNKRLLEDSLIFKFSDYIYRKNPDETIENLKKVGVKYLLTDLNAATIDQDENHNLTTRYEKLLSTYVSDQLELIDTDSICLKTALDDYRVNKNIDTYMTIAGVNYESYINQKTVPRGEKAMFCYNYIYDLLESDKISGGKYELLEGLKQYYTKNKETLDTQEKVVNFLYLNFGKSYKVLFKIK